MSLIMVDLETCGVRAGCAILSIGAVEFNPTTGALGAEFYQVINLRSCWEAGLHIFEPTMAWWEKQSEAAKEVLNLATGQSETAVPLVDALSRFNTYLAQFTTPVVYGNGADFDNAILIAAYASVGLKQGWNVFSGGCYRTLKRDVCPDIDMVTRQGTYHNALDDAKNQAMHAIAIFQRLEAMKKSWAP